MSRALGLAEHYDDLEDLTTERLDVNAKLRKEAIWKVREGCQEKKTVSLMVFCQTPPPPPPPPPGMVFLRIKKFTPIFSGN